MTPSEMPTVRPTVSAYCPRCGAVLVTVPCRCDPVPAACRASVAMDEAVSRMTADEVRSFLAWRASRTRPRRD